MKKYKLIVYFALMSVISVEAYETILLESIDRSQLTRIKYACKREVFTDDGDVYKIWSDDYPGSRRFINALEAGYFDDIAKISAVIRDEKGKCRGYVTPKGEKLSMKEVKVTKFAPDQRPTWGVADPRFKDFLKKLVDKIHTHHFIFLDFTAQNVIRYDGDYYIIDLESVYSKKQIVEMQRSSRKFFNQAIVNFPYRYRIEVMNSL